MSQHRGGHDAGIGPDQLRLQDVPAFQPTTTPADPTQQPAANKLAQDFTTDVLNRKWVTDITYLPTTAGWVYLAVVVDLFSRKVIFCCSPYHGTRQIKTYPRS